MSPATSLRVQVRYVGRVQGVGFRATCRWVAESHPITGWVRNEHDGSVVLEVQGDSMAVEEFLTAISTRLAQHIVSQNRTSLSPVQDERGFVIAR